MIEWVAIETLPPAGEVLIWAQGKVYLACLLTGVGKDGPWRAFMDARSDEILPWPTHWMPVPDPPQGMIAGNGMVPRDGIEPPTP